MTVDIVSLSFQIDSTKVTQATAALSQMSNVTIETQRNLDRARGSFNDAGGAISSFERGLNLLRNALMTVGVAFAGMRLTEFANEATLAAARYETLGVVMTRISQNTNFSTQQLFEFAKGIQNTGISMVESRQAAIQMIQAHLDLSKATQLARVAQDAAVVGNMNSTDAFMTLVHGIQTAQTETLRTVGININLDDTYLKLATSMNKNVAALTQQEKSQAVMNAVIAAGSTIAGSYTAAMDTAGKQLNSMKRYVDDLMVSLGAAALPAFSEAIFRTTEQIKSIQHYLDSPSGRAWLDTLASIGLYIERNLMPILATLAAMVGARLVVAFVAFITSVERLKATFLAFGAGNPYIAGFMLLAGAVAYLTTRQSEASSAIEHGLALAKQQADQSRDTSGVLTEQAKREALLTSEMAKRNAEAVKGQIAAIQSPAGLMDSLFGGGSAGNLTARATRKLVEDTVRPPDPLSIAGSVNAEFGAAIKPGILSGVGSQTLTDIEALMTQMARTDAPMNLASISDKIITINAALRDEALRSPEALKALLEFTKVTQPILEAQQAVDALVKSSDDWTKKAQEMADKATAVNVAMVDTSQTMAVAIKTVQGLGLSFDPVGGIMSKTESDAAAHKATIQGAIDDLRKYREQALALTMDPATSEQDRTHWVDEIISKTRTLNQLLKDQGAVYQQIDSAATSAFAKSLQSFDQQMQLVTNNPIQQARIRAEQQVRSELFNVNTGELKLVGEQIGKAWSDGVKAGLDIPKDPTGMTDAAQAETLIRAAGLRGAQLAGAQQSLSTSQATNEARIRADYAFRIAQSEADGGTAVARLTDEMERALEAQKGVANYAALAARSWEEQARSLGDAVAKLRDMAATTENTERMAAARLQGPGAVAIEQQRQDIATFMRTYVPGYGAPQLPGLAGIMPGGAPGGVTRVTVVGPSGAPIASGLSKEDFLTAAMQRESGGQNITQKSGGPGSGYWQMEDRSRGGSGTWEEAAKWAGLHPMSDGGFGRAMDYSKQDQYAAASALYDRRGEQPWAMSARRVSGIGDPGVGGATLMTPERQAQLLAEANAQFSAKAFAGIADRSATDIESRKEAVALEKVEITQIGATNAARDEAIAKAKQAIQYSKDMAVAELASDEAQRSRQVAKVQSDDATIQKLIEEKRAQDDLRQSTQDWNDAMIGVADSLSTAFADAVINGKSLQDVLLNLLKSIEQILIKAAITGPLEKALTGGGGWIGNLLGGLGGGGAAAGAGLMGGEAALSGLPALYAKGNVFPSGIDGYRNSIVTSPTLFRFASGTGLMGEAGPEAILPLVRGAGGDLGVRGGGSNVTVNAPITIAGGAVPQNGKPMDAQTMRLLQQQLEQSIRQAVRMTMAEEKRPGGDLFVR